MKIEPETFMIGPTAEAMAVIDSLSDWLFSEGFGEDSPDLAHRLYTRCKITFGEGQYRIMGTALERLGSAWGAVVMIDEIERFLAEVE